MGYDNWCYCCRNITQAVDLNKCNGCKQNENDHLPPSKFKPGNMYGGLNKKEEKMEKKGIDTLLVSYDNVSNDKPVLIIGRKGTRGPVQIVNAFQDEEAEEVYKKLTTKED